MNTYETSEKMLICIDSRTLVMKMEHATEHVTTHLLNQLDLKINRWHQNIGLTQGHTRPPWQSVTSKVKTKMSGAPLM